MVSRSGGQTTAVADDFVLGFPVGFGLTKVGRFTLDLEVVPMWQNDPADVSVELHPGLVTGLGPGAGRQTSVGMAVHVGVGF
jgi:hypothetical protein